MFFVGLARFRKKPSKEFLENAGKLVESPPPGIKVHNVFWTLGRFDSVIVFEAPDEKAAMKMALPVSEYMATETMTAITREEALKLMETA